jgi:predicted ester cyclase
MSAKDVAQAAMMAWESKDASALASCLSDNFVCTGFLPQHLEKQQFIDLMKTLTTAFPDWSFNAHLLEEQGDAALFVTHITATHSGDLILPTLPLILPTGQKVSLPDRHTTYTVAGDKITAIRVDYPANRIYSPTNVVADILAQMGMELPR